MIASMYVYIYIIGKERKNKEKNGKDEKGRKESFAFGVSDLMINILESYSALRILVFICFFLVFRMVVYIQAITCFKLITFMCVV